MAAMFGCRLLVHAGFFDLSYGVNRIVGLADLARPYMKPLGDTYPRGKA